MIFKVSGNRVSDARRKRFVAILLLLCLSLFTVALTSAQGGATVSLDMTTDSIPTLVDANGMTLYTFQRDHEGEPTCYDRCAEVWPAYTIEAGVEPNAGEGVPGQLGTVEREDGTLQVTYLGWPLYYFYEDAAPGDANGQGLEDVWFAANPATVMVSDHPGFGQILVGAGGMTLYYFTQDEIEDEGSESYCYEECAVAWPPLVVTQGMQPLADPNVPGELGLIAREDGTQQVTYNGWPLYFFKADEKPGDINGSAVKKVWWVATPTARYEPMSVGLELVAEGLTAPIAFIPAPDGSGRFFIADQVGQILILTPEGQLLEEPFLDLSQQIVPLMEEFDERGVLGLAFHPDYVNNGRFFVYYTVPLRPEGPEGWDHTNIVAEFSVTPDDPNRADLNTQKIIWAIDHPQFNHDAGQIAFGPDGYLYIPIGDGGGANDVDLGHTEGIGNAQDTTNLHGSILRIDVNTAFPYTIPPDNPFAAADDGVADEIFAFGLRNPWRISFSADGQLFVSDAGQDLFEEVNIVTAGGNYGWNIKEGTHCFDPNNPSQPPAECATVGTMGEALVDPIIEYGHELGVAAVGGFLYRGSAIPELNGYYIFGDYTEEFTATFVADTGTLFAAQPSDQGLWAITELAVANMESGKIDSLVLSFGQDESGELYVLTQQSLGPVGETGRIYKLVPAAGAAPIAAPAETGAEQATGGEEAPAETGSETGGGEEAPAPQETPETSGG